MNSNSLAGCLIIFKHTAIATQNTVRSDHLIFATDRKCSIFLFVLKKLFACSIRMLSGKAISYHGDFTASTLHHCRVMAIGIPELR